MVLRICKYGEPVLEQKAAPITDFDTPELRQLVENMFETMYANKGIGLAAPQVGVSQRLAVIDPSSGDNPDDRLVLINPEIVSREGCQLGEEGCLSFPGFREDVKRASKVRMRAQNVKGETFEVEHEELLARAMQHELDHLDGIVFITHLSLLKRDLIRRKIRKLAKAGEW